MMENRLPVMNVHMFGEFSLEYGGRRITFGRDSDSRAMKLLQILLFCGDKGISRVKLLEDMYDRDELEDVSGDLEAVCRRLSEILVKAGLPEYEYIKLENGAYRWQSPMEVRTDTQEFSECVEQAYQEDTPARIELLRKACEIYRGEFLPGGSSGAWVLVESVKYKKQYTRALKEVCDHLMKRQEYEAALNLCTAASEIYPLDEWQVRQIDCLMALNRYREAMQIYEETTKRVFEKLGTSPSDRMTSRYREMSSMMGLKTRNIGDIKCGLDGDYEEGALYCTFFGFKNNYRLVRRMIERNGQSVYLMLCTITDGTDRLTEDKERLEAMSDELYDSIKFSLRRVDFFTKCSPTQYLILLVGTNQENTQMIYERILRRFSKKHKSWKEYLDFYVSTIDDVERDNSRISFRGDSFLWD